MVVLSGSSGLLCQDKMLPYEPEGILSSNPGFISINELTTGIGLGITDVPYSKSFFGFTTVNGYQINKSFVAALGTGLSFYNGGLLVPLFLDFRYRFKIDLITPYVFADGGLLLNFSDINVPKLFVNPGIGIRYSFSRNIAVNLGSGLLIQSGGSGRDAFINIKAGVTYKF
jgi:hypothetical protein